MMVSHCVIGAGFSGLPVAKKLLELGDKVVVVDRNTGPGGLWRTGAYEHASIISSRDTTGMPDYPMPDSYPDFPGKHQMAAYLSSYADRFGLMPHCRFETSVSRVRPGGRRRWTVDLDRGESLEVDTVTVAGGHHSDPRPVSHPGEFTGENLRSDAYRTPDQLKDRRVLVVGYGNTGCDIAAAASRVNGSADISMRSGAYFFPKLFLGRPTAELGRRLPIKGDWVDRLIARTVYRCAVGDPERYGLQRPDFRILDKHPIVNTELLELIRHGRVRPRPDISHLSGSTVHFVDGTVGEYDLLVYAVGYRVSLPMLRAEDHLIDWEDGLPILHSQLIAPRVRGLFINGLGQARTGGGPLFQHAGYLVARMAAYEARSPIAITTAIDGHRSIRFAHRYLNYDSVSKADTRSYGQARHNRSLRHLTTILDDVGCPDAGDRDRPDSLGAPNQIQDRGRTPVAGATTPQKGRKR
jgi:hypothetical protein